MQIERTPSTPRRRMGPVEAISNTRDSDEYLPFAVQVEQRAGR